MSIEGLLFALVIAAVAIGIAGAPLVRQAIAGNDHRVEQARQHDRAQVYYDRVLRNLRDLDEDRLLEKIDPDAYEQERAIWVQRGIRVLKALEQIDNGIMIAPYESDEAAIDRSLDELVEAAVRDFRQQQSI